MSQWGFANVTKAYLNRLTARTAMDVVKRGATAGYARGYLDVAYIPGMTEGAANLFGLRRGAMGAARAFRGWAWPTRGANLAATRATRTGTVAGIGLLGTNFLNPKDNWGPF